MLGRFLEFAVSGRRVIDAPCDAVWDQLVSVDDWPSIFSQMAAVERIDGSNPGEQLRAGTRVRMHRRTALSEKGGEDETFGSDWVITSASEDGSGCSGRRTLSCCALNFGGEGITASKTWTVEPLEEARGRAIGRRCLVTRTVAAMPHRLFVSLGRIVFSPTLKKKAKTVLDCDLQDLETACIGKLMLQREKMPAGVARQRMCWSAKAA